MPYDEKPYQEAAQWCPADASWHVPIKCDTCRAIKAALEAERAKK